jgi:hypothetical protein
MTTGAKFALSAVEIALDSQSEAAKGLFGGAGAEGLMMRINFDAPKATSGPLAGGCKIEFAQPTWSKFS